MHMSSHRLVVLFALGFSLCSSGCGGTGLRPSHPQAPAAPPALTDVDAWAAQLRQAAASPAAFTDLLLRVDPEYGSGPEALAEDGNGLAAPVAAVEVFRGQLDDDPEPEVVVQVRRHSADFVAGQERDESYWIGVFDHRPAGWVLVGTIRERVGHCGWDEAKLGLLLGFTPARAGRQAALWVRTQDTDSCGTLVSFNFEKTAYRVTAAGLQETKVAAPAGMDHDRIARFQADDESESF
jgi:hypothetical protein